MLGKFTAAATGRKEKRVRGREGEIPRNVDGGWNQRQGCGNEGNINIQDEAM